jgi:hypothetical protein
MRIDHSVYQVGVIQCVQIDFCAAGHHTGNALGKRLRRSAPRGQGLSDVDFNEAKYRPR